MYEKSYLSYYYYKGRNCNTEILTEKSGECQERISVSHYSVIVIIISSQ